MLRHAVPAHRFYLASSALALSGVMGSSFAKNAQRNAASASARVYFPPIGNGLPRSVGRPQYKVLDGCRTRMLRWILLTILHAGYRGVGQQSEAPVRSNCNSAAARFTSAG